MTFHTTSSPDAAEELAFKAGAPVFWLGNHLLEGVVDHRGYSGETITLNTRLTPPKGGKLWLPEVHGSHTNLLEVIF